MGESLQSYANKEVWTFYDEAAVLKLDYVQRAELAKSISCEGLLVDLSLDQHVEVRKGVAENPKTPLATLKRLAEQDLCISVQKAARETLTANELI